jgi:hypothetical protein
MTQERLATLIENPEVQYRVVGDYDGGYSLGVTSDPQKPDEAAIRVRVEGEATEIPSSISIGAETIRVIAQPHFVRPRPLATRR